MDERGVPLPAATTDTSIITLELVGDEDEGDPELINAVGRDTVATLQREGFILRPVYTGQRGGPFVVEVLQAVEQAAVQLWANHTAIEEGLTDLASLVTIFGSVPAIITWLRLVHKQQVGKDESVAHPIKISVEVNGARLAVEASDETEADAALVLARQFLIAHPKEAAQVTPKSPVKVQGRVPRKQHRHRK